MPNTLTSNDNYNLLTPERDPELLQSLNILVQESNSVGAWGNVIAVHKGLTALPNQIGVSFNGSRNVIRIDKDCGITGHFWFEGDEFTADLYGGQQHAQLFVQLYAGAQLVWGARSRTYGARLWIHGGRKIVVGSDCLMSDGIQMRTSDHHSIIDLDTMTQTNHPADIVIGRHVWIGANCYIMKGAVVGDGAIVATASVVTRAVPAKELWAGVPASRVRRNVSWVDSHPAGPADLAALADLLADSGLEL